MTLIAIEEQKTVQVLRAAAARACGLTVNQWMTRTVIQEIATRLHIEHMLSHGYTMQPRTFVGSRSC